MAHPYDTYKHALIDDEMKQNTHWVQIPRSKTLIYDTNFHKTHGDKTHTWMKKSLAMYIIAINRPWAAILSFGMSRKTTVS